MEAIALHILDLIWDKSDPLLIICILILGYGQISISRKLSKHMDPDNPHPHTSCWLGEESYKALEKLIDKLD